MKAKRDLPLAFVGSLLLGLLLAACPPVAHGYDRAQLAPPSSVNPPQLRVLDEQAIQLEILRLEAREQHATHVGVEHQRGIVLDPDPETMRLLLATRPLLRSTSALVKPGAVGTYTLITVSDITWQSNDQASVCGIYRSAEGRLSSHRYIATRRKADKNDAAGWDVKLGMIGCGPWKKFTAQHDGTRTVIAFRRP